MGGWVGVGGGEEVKEGEWVGGWMDGVGWVGVEWDGWINLSFFWFVNGM